MKIDESKFYDRAEELLNKSLEWLEDNYCMSEDEKRSIIGAICQLAEEVEKSKYSDNLQIFEAGCKFMREYDYEGIHPSTISADIQFEFEKLYQDKNSNLYTKEQVEELLAKQRELCAEKADLDYTDFEQYVPKTAIYTGDTYYGYYYISKEAILNAKLNLD